MQADISLNWVETTAMKKEVTGIQNQEIIMGILILLNCSCFPGQTAKPVSSSPTGFGFALNRGGKEN